jgi:hypothetical protein
VGVRDVIAELRSLAAEFTYLCHDQKLQSWGPRSARLAGAES